jgi:2-desacetyl-2-hydroxyethyl bacteriochlorophyllide A dehydrogenase
VKAALLRRPRDLSIEDTAMAEPGADEVIVRVRMAGLCGTDFRIWSGDRPVAYPRVMGHELIGTVAQVGRDVTRVRAGDRVAVEPNYSCGRCPLCREGNRNLCLRRTAIGIDVDGGFAELVRIPERCCWPLAGDVTDGDVVVVEPLAVVLRAVDRGAVRAGETAAVLGAGTLGLLAAQLLRLRGARVLVVSRTARRFALARRHGVEGCHALSDGPLSEAARAFSGREGVDLVVETAGTPEAVEQAVELVRPGGRIVLTGLPHAPSALSFFTVVRRELTLLGSMIYQDEFPEALRLLESGRIRGAELITHRFPLEDLEKAFEAHRDPASIKVAVTI